MDLFSDTIPPPTTTAATRPIPNFRPLSRTLSVSKQEKPEVQVKNELDSIPLSTLLQKHFNRKQPKQEPQKEEQGADDTDQLIGDSNFEAAGVASDFVNIFKEINDDDLYNQGFVQTNRYLKAEFNEPTARRFGTRERQVTQRWTEEETDLFYRVLAMCGTDFSMISKFFPDRSRKMIVNKFHREEAKNKEKILECISKHDPLDLNMYASIVGIDESSIIDDYQKNKAKLSGKNSLFQSSKRDDKQNQSGDESNESDEWVSASESEEPNLGDVDVREADNHDDDEIEGDLNF
ncbi:transcription factor TFIIIB component [Histomonas meleagridis]|uniref:transcription factor TFIIIB component n=1 Tax=Histomonas meleagridis TaxID=135588 RepID=UPI0035594F68|nr:transcription factor TFIIIB component [Histomonas meleagridis]